MNIIEEAVFNHLNMNTNGALMITGDWGSGKTHYLKNDLFPKVAAKSKFQPLIISVYGETDKKNLAQKVAFAYANSKSAGFAEGVAKVATKITEALPIISKYVNVEKLIAGNGENLLKLLPHGELLICFDDVERMSDKLNINDFLGVVNDLVENCGAKVLIVANYDHILTKDKAGDKKNPIIYLEKTVEKAVHYEPNMPEVFDHIISGYPAEFKAYLITKKDLILASITVESAEDKWKPLKKQLQNIRTLKFALEHFRIVFEIIRAGKKWDDELTLKQLDNIWSFVLAISNEFRQGESISFADNFGLDALQSALPEFDLSRFLSLTELDAAEEAGEPDQKEDYLKNFRANYFERLDADYKYYPAVYELITGGKVIEPASFLKLVDELFYVDADKVNPAHELLNRFNAERYYSFSNTEFPAMVSELFSYLAGGQFENIRSYIDAANVILYFKDFIGVVPEDIYKATQNDIDQVLKDTQDNPVIESQLDMLSHSIQDADLMRIYQSIRDRMRDIAKEREKNAAEELNELLIKAPDEFIEKLMPTDMRIRTPQRPFLEEIDLDKLAGVVPTWEPTTINKLANLLEARYLTGGFTERLTGEIKFLEVLQSFDKDTLKEPNLTKFTILNSLQPEVAKALKVLRSHAQAPEN